MIVPKHTALEILRDVWWVGAVALGVSLVATPIVRFIAYRSRIVDRPDDLLKPHGRPVAYMGGVAMCLGLLVGLACCLAIMPQAHWQALRSDFGELAYFKLAANPIFNLLGFALASIVITTVGLLDDILEIRARQKVLGQVVAAVILMLGGVGSRVIMVFFSPLGIELPYWIMLPLSLVMCIVLVVATCNASNLLDGLDGLCGGVTGIIALGFLALAVWLAMWGIQGREDFDFLRVGLCLAMAGAVLGFLPYNIPPASIFMGDAGSMLLGLFVGTMMVMFCERGNVRWFIAAWAVFALPTTDTGLAVVRRTLSGKSIFAGDRSHLYDQLVDRGMSVKQVVLLFYVLATLAAVVGVVVAITLRARYAIPLYLVIIVIISTIFYKLGMVTPESHLADSDQQEDSTEKETPSE